MTQWYEALFSNYAKKYEDESFTKGTLTEVDFLEKEVAHQKSVQILDIGCGTGRHTIELARRGYQVTGIDLSKNMLNKAIENAKAAQVKARFIQADARSFYLDEKFDLVIMLCEGGFSLMETDEMNFSILKQASKALLPGGKFIFTCLNALFPLSNSIDKLVSDGTSGVHKGRFDMMTFRDYSTYEFVNDLGEKQVLNCNERYYAPSEINFMLRQLGFSKVEIFGAEIGLYDRNRPLRSNDYEMLVIAEK